MGTIIMNGAVVGSNCVIGAGSLVTGGTVIPDGSVVVGSPAKVISSVTEKPLEMIRHNAEEYVALMMEYRDGDFKNESLR
jgi:carbonic anhydrase/acetyltransferase-like protein (isoleucine patch superfamily)